MKYKIVKCKPWIEEMQKTIDTWTEKGWELVSHSSNMGTAGYTFVFRK